MIGWKVVEKPSEKEAERGIVGKSLIYGLPFYTEENQPPVGFGMFSFFRTRWRAEEFAQSLESKETKIVKIQAEEVITRPKMNEVYLRAHGDKLTHFNTPEGTLYCGSFRILE